MKISDSLIPRNGNNYNCDRKKGMFSMRKENKQNNLSQKIGDLGVKTSIIY